MSRDRVATYRLQLHAGFDFDSAASVAGYLKDLGISHLYLSPILAARRGSQHGYDVVDHERLNSELGGAEGFENLVRTWSPGEIIVDIVVNHMAITDANNRWWWDVLKHGPGSRYASFFDIDWDPNEERLKRSILVPVLGDHYGRVLEAGDIKLEHRGDEAVVCYHEHELPLAPSSRPHDLDAINDDVDLLHEILEAQHYRLAYWKVAGHELNYRRFFAINDLAALRIDRGEVFEAVHPLILSLVRQGSIHGLRIDHVDGLRYPLEYLQRLQTAAEGRYVVVEKILEGDEELRPDWPVAGTTGYEFIAKVDGLFVAPEAEPPLTELYATFTGTEAGPQSLAIEAKHQIMDTELAADVERLTEEFVAVCEDQRRYRDFTRPELRQTLRETLASVSVYRTYVDARTKDVDDADARAITRAIDDARERRPDLDGELFDLLGAVLLLEIEGSDEAALAMRFQQTSGPVMAKGIEDTLFYRYLRFVALNEVGGEPAHFSTSVDDFHRFNLRVQAKWPETMLATSTHDTKRSEDVRMRLALLSEIPDEWSRAVTRWSQHNAQHRRGEWPDRNTEYLLYQTLVGAWPLTVERATYYMDKAVKEAKTHTSWINPNYHHDSEVARFVDKVMTDTDFMSDLERFVTPLIEPGYVNSLTQTLLKMMSPGVPDFYQGTEIWDFSLVDPDNRRPIDYDSRRDLLEEVSGLDPREIWARKHSGVPKLFLIKKALETRTRYPRAFGRKGTYEPLHPTGAHPGNVVAFARGGEVAVIAPRLVLSLGVGWEDTAVNLPAGRWTDVMTGRATDEVARMADVLDPFPVALLTRAEG